MKKWIHIANWTIIIIGGFLIYWLASYFFIGREEDHQILIDGIGFSLIFRSLGIFIFSTIPVLIFCLLNFILNYFLKINDKYYPIRISLWALLFLLIASIIGTINFLFL